MIGLGPIDSAHSVTRPMVLVVEPVGGHGGMEFWDHFLCESLVAAGWRPLLLTSQGMQDAALNYEVMEVYRGVFGPGSKLGRGLCYVEASIKGFWSGRQRGARVIHFHFFHVGALQYFSVVLGRFLGFRVVVSAHDVGSFRAGESQWILRELYRHCAAVITYSDQARETLEDVLSVPPEKIFGVPLGNYDGFLPPLPAKEAAQASLGYVKDDFVVLFFGQFKRVKRLDLLLQAAALARARGAGRLRVLAAGSRADSDLGELNRLIDDGDLRDIVQLHAEYISNEDLPRYFAAADIVALPYDNIYQSGVVLLAMTNRVPVLTSDIRGMREVVRDGETGLTFRAGDVDDLAEKLCALVDGRWDLDRLASEAREYVVSEHGWARCGLVTADVYRAALGQNGARATVLESAINRGDT